MQEVAAVDFGPMAPRKPGPAKRTRGRLDANAPVVLAVRNIANGQVRTVAKLLGISHTALYRLMNAGYANNAPYDLVKKLAKLSRVKESILAPQSRSGGKKK